MGKHEITIYNYAQRMSVARDVGSDALKGLSTSSNQPVPHLFAAGNAFYRLAAGINGGPLH